MPDIVYPSINVHAEQRVVPATVTGFPLGLPAVVRPDVAYDSLTLAPGDALDLYSDGVVEAYSPLGELYDEERFETLLNETFEGADASRVIRTAVRDVDRFIGSAPRTDDVTVLVLKRDPDGQDTNTQ